LSRICVGASSFATSNTVAEDLLKSSGYEIVLNPFGRRLTKSETIDFLQDAVGLLAGLELLDAEVFTQVTTLKAIARIGAGMDNVDLTAAAHYQIKVSNTPDAPTAAVAEMTLAALLCCARGLATASNDLHRGMWSKQIGFSLYDSTILLVGYGRIARAFETLLAPFKPTVLIYDPFVRPDTELVDLLACADVVSLHASGHDMILSASEIALLKPGAILLNSARGGLVDETAVAEALSEGRLNWYWADTFSKEPYSGILCSHPRALLTPHISTYTALCRNTMELEAVQNLIRDLQDV
jgi:D-3-phosphoglycerate dehydrogenase